MDSASNKACYQKALQILARRDHSCAELRTKLKSRGFGLRDIETVIRKCNRLNYLDDTRFAAAYLRQLQCKGHGINSMQNKLHAKGVPNAVVRDTVAPYRADNVQLDLCRHVTAKKMKSLAGDKRMVDPVPKLQRFLFNRGFSNRIIRQTVNDVLSIKN